MQLIQFMNASHRYLQHVHGAVIFYSVNHGKLRAEVDTEGEISNLDHCIIPRVPPAPTCCLTDYDKECIKFALAHNVSSMK